MKLYMQQKAFTWGVPLPLWNKSGHTRYTVIGDAYSWGKRLHVQDLAGREAIYVRQKVPAMFPQYEIEAYGRPVGTIVKDLTFLRPRYRIESLEWEVSGAMGLGDYEITWQNTVVASNRPVKGKEGDLFVLEVYDRTAERPALAVLLTINCILAAQEPKRL